MMDMMKFKALIFNTILEEDVCGNSVSQLASDLIDFMPGKIAEMFDSSISEFEDFLEYCDFRDEILKDCKSFYEWADVFDDYDRKLIYKEAQRLYDENKKLKKKDFIVEIRTN